MTVGCDHVLAAAEAVLLEGSRQFLAWTAQMLPYASCPRDPGPSHIGEMRSFEFQASCCERVT